LRRSATMFFVFAPVIGYAAHEYWGASRRLADGSNFWARL
jgi:hypothetical protein